MSKEAWIREAMVTAERLRLTVGRLSMQPVSFTWAEKQELMLIEAQAATIRRALANLIPVPVDATGPDTCGPSRAEASAARITPDAPDAGAGAADPAGCFGAESDGTIEGLCCPNCKAEWLVVAGVQALRCKRCGVRIPFGVGWRYGRDDDGESGDTDRGGPVLQALPEDPGRGEARIVVEPGGAMVPEPLPHGTGGPAGAAGEDGGGSQHHRGDACPECGGGGRWLDLGGRCKNCGAAGR